MNIKKSTTIHAKEISLKPYIGRIFYAKTAEKYQKAYLDLFGTANIINENAQLGRTRAGNTKDGRYTYLV